MSLPPPDYHTTRSIGTGRSNPADVRRLRRALGRLGYGRSGNPPAENVTPGLMDAVERFQSDFGLEPDSTIRPGGPTERALAMTLRAHNEGGEPAVATLRDEFARHAAAGFTFEPDPADRNAGLWRDEDGRIQVNAGGEDRFGKPGLVAAESGRQRGGAGIPGGRRGSVLFSIIDLIRRETAKERWKQQERKSSPEHAPSGAKRSISEPPPDVPPFPAEPPDLGDRDTAPPELPRLPERMKTPEGPPKLPEDGHAPIEGPKPPDKLIFTSLEDDEFWRQVFILRRWGSPQTQELNDRVGRRAAEIAKEYGCNLKMTHGGFGEDENGERKYQSELRLKAGEKLKDSRHRLRNGSWVDVVLRDAAAAEAEEPTANLLINTVDTYARTGALKPGEQWQKTKVLQNKETDDIFITIPKPRGEVELDEYVKGFDPKIRATVKEFCSKIRK